MARTIYIKDKLTGGTTDALDGIDGSTLITGDLCFTVTTAWKLYCHYLSTNTTNAESSPTYIKPDVNGGTAVVWIKLTST